MGWEDEHLHQFTIGTEVYGEASVKGYRRVRDEKRSTLGELVPAAPAKFAYLYDFSVNWEFEVSVEEITPPVEGQVLPLCLKGKRAAPPELIGGSVGVPGAAGGEREPTPSRTRAVCRVDCQLRSRCGGYGRDQSAIEEGKVA